VCIGGPTPIADAKAPDLRAVISTAQKVGATLTKGQLIVLESTTYPGTTDEVVRPILEEASGLSADGDFLLAFSPEREDPGNKAYNVSNIPKVVGGVTPAATKAAADLYRKVAPSVVEVASARVAEAAKMLENTYRAVNIALVNELKVIFESMGINIWDVIEAAKTKPFGFHAFTPGPGMGGHCIPVDPFYLSWKARTLGHEARFIELAGRVNVEMPRYVVERLDRALDERGKPLTNSRILILGAAYKPDIDDDRESPFYEIADMLKGRGAHVQYHDPHIPHIRPTRHHRLVLESVPLDEKALSSADAVVVVTNHSTFDPSMVVRHAKLVVDTRNFTAAITEGREKIVMA
jgi:UDP-N-acetyl-D-glucosamine dehydrogenase